MNRQIPFRWEDKVASSLEIIVLALIDTAFTLDLLAALIWHASSLSLGVGWGDDLIAFVTLSVDDGLSLSRVERFQVQEFLREVGHSIKSYYIGALLLLRGVEAIGEAPETAVSLDACSGRADVDRHAGLA